MEDQNKTYYYSITDIALDDALYKMLDKLESGCSITKTNCDQVCLQMFPKSLNTNWQDPSI